LDTADWLTSSLSLDNSAHVHISYVDASLTLTYVTNKTGSWVTTALESAMVGFDDTGGGSRIALDGLDNAHVSYISDIELTYASKTTGSWLVEVVDSLPSPPGSPSIALDSSGHAHISYTGFINNQELMYTTNASGSWVTTLLTEDGVYWISDTSIAVDNLGYAHISYFDGSPDDLLYSTNESGSWVTETVSGGPNSPIMEYTSIALNSRGKVYISYYNVWDKSLGLANNVFGFCLPAEVDANGQVGEYNSLAIDSSNRAHISYYDAGNEDLKYATDASGSWVTVPVDTAGSVGKYTSLALDSSNKAHISYYDATNDTLKYASNATGPWTTMTVCNRPEGCGSDSSIGVTSLGHIMISHLAGEGGLLLTSGPSCEDSDGDGYGSPASPECTYPARDCHDGNPEVHPAATEGPFGAPNCSDGLDNDCDGRPDTADESCRPEPSCAESAEASTLGVDRVYGASELAGHLTFFLLPTGALIGLWHWRRKR
jgi:hypothetical protein